MGVAMLSLRSNQLNFYFTLTFRTDFPRFLSVFISRFLSHFPRFLASRFCTDIPRLLEFLLHISCRFRTTFLMRAALVMKKCVGFLWLTRHHQLALLVFV